MSKIYNDEELALLSINNPAHFDVLVQRHHSALCNFIYKRFVKTREQAEDIVQEAWLRAYLHLEDFDPCRKWKTWLYQIAINYACNVLREGSHIEIVALEEGLREHGSPFESVENQKNNDMIKNVLNAIDEAYKKVLEMYYLWGWSCEKIAKQLQTTSLAVKAKIKYAERAVLILYQPEWLA